MACHGVPAFVQAFRVLLVAALLLPLGVPDASAQRGETSPTVKLTAPDKLVAGATYRAEAVVTFPPGSGSMRVEVATSLAVPLIGWFGTPGLDCSLPTNGNGIACSMAYTGQYTFTLSGIAPEDSPYSVTSWINATSRHDVDRRAQQWKATKVTPVSDLAAETNITATSVDRTGLAFRATARNLGPSGAPTTLTLSWSGQGSVALDGAQTGCTSAASKVTCDLGRLASGASASRLFRATALRDGKLDVVAEATAPVSHYDPKPTNGRAVAKLATVADWPSFDVRAVVPDPSPAFSPVTLGVSIRNNGGYAPAPRLELHVPEGVALERAPPGCSLSLAYFGTLVDCALDPILARSSRLVEFGLALGATDAGFTVIVRHANATTRFLTPAILVVETGAPVLRLDARANATAYPGQSVEATVTLANDGTASARGVEVRVDASGPVTSTRLASAHATCTGARCTVDRLLPNGTATIQVTSAVSSSAAQDALVSWTATSGALTATANATVAAATSDLEFSEFSASPSSPRVNDTLTVRLALRNRGPANVGNAYIETRIPDGLDITQDRYGPCVRLDRVVRCFLGAIDSGATRWANVSVTARLADTYTANGTVGMTRGTDPVSANDARTLTVTVRPAESVTTVTATSRKMPDLPGTRIAPFGGAVGGKLVVAGGYDAGSARGETFVYDPATNAWTTARAMTPRYTGAGAVLQGELWAVGGWTVSPPYPYTDSFVFDGTTWRSGPALPRLSGCGAAAAYGDTLYVFSPCDGYSGYRNNVWSTTGGTWSARPGPGPAHVDAAAAATADGFFLFGGTDPDGRPLASVSRFANGAWSAAAPMPTARAGASAAVVDGIVYVLGGSANGIPLATVEAYDPARDAWTTLPALATARDNGVAVALGSTIYVAAGRDASGGLTSVESITLAEASIAVRQSRPPRALPSGTVS